VALIRGPGQKILTLSTICYTNRGERLYFPVKQENLLDGNELDVDFGTLGDCRISCFPRNASPKKLILFNNHAYERLSSESAWRSIAATPDNCASISLSRKSCYPEPAEWTSSQLLTLLIKTSLGNQLFLVREHQSSGLIVVY